jgi:hypothetical protein
VKERESKKARSSGSFANASRSSAGGWTVRLRSVELEVHDDAVSGLNADGLAHVAVEPKQIAAAVNRNGGAESMTVDLRGHRCARFAPLLFDVEWDLEHVAAAALLDRRFEPRAGIIREPGLLEAPGWVVFSRIRGLPDQLPDLGGGGP